MTAFPESTSFKLTVWNILGDLQGKKKWGGVGVGVMFLDLHFSASGGGGESPTSEKPTEGSC